MIMNNGTVIMDNENTFFMTIWVRKCLSTFSRGCRYSDEGRISYNLNSTCKVWPFGCPTPKWFTYVFHGIDPEIFKDVDRHIGEGDEDVTVATVLDLLRQNIEKNDFTEKSSFVMRKLVARLVYRQRMLVHIPKKELSHIRQSIAITSTRRLICGKWFFGWQIQNKLINIWQMRLGCSFFLAFTCFA